MRDAHAGRILDCPAREHARAPNRRYRIITLPYVVIHNLLLQFPILEAILRSLDLSPTTMLDL